MTGKPRWAVWGGKGTARPPVPSPPVSLPEGGEEAAGTGQRAGGQGTEPPVCGDSPVLKETDGAMLITAFLGAE